MTINNIDIRNFFRTAPASKRESIEKLTKMLQTDIDNGIYEKLLGLFPEADHYAAYMEAAHAYYGRDLHDAVYLTSVKYPELFI